MITCIVKRCLWTTNSIDRLYDHLRRHHQHVTSYSCNYESCTRCYNVRASFFRHFKKHFNNELDHRNTNFDAVPQNNEYFTMKSEAQTPQPNDLQPEKDELCSSYNTMDSYNNIETPATDAENSNIIDITALENQMRNLSIGFNLKWLDVNVLPRKVVFEIQHDVQQKILKPLEDVVNTMQTVGLLSMEAQTIFKKMFAMFDGTETEYKFIECLKSADLYVVPREFVISNELRPGVIHNEQGMDNDPITGKYKNTKNI